MIFFQVSVNETVWCSLCSLFDTSLPGFTILCDRIENVIIQYYRHLVTCSFTHILYLSYWFQKSETKWASNKKFQYFFIWDAEKDKGRQILNLCFCPSPRGKCSLSYVACFFSKTLAIPAETNTQLAWKSAPETGLQTECICFGPSVGVQSCCVLQPLATFIIPGQHLVKFGWAVGSPWWQGDSWAVLSC